MMWNSPRTFWRRYAEQIITAALLAVIVAALALMVFAALSPETMLKMTDAMLEAQ